MKTTSLLLLVLPATLASLEAQTPDHLVGLTRNASALRHQDHWACAPLGQCPVPGMPPAAALPPYAGGTGWDPATSGAWVTNGLLLGKIDDTCVMQCPPAVVPTLGPNAFLTGLEVVESLNQLWMVDSQGFLHRYTNTCPPMPLGTCNTGLVPAPAQKVTTGLAVDEGLGLVFIAYPDLATGANFVSVSMVGAPCTPICGFQVPPCAAGFGAIRGLAVNWARRTLYATDGANTVAMQYAATATACVTIVAVNCCALPAIADPMIGLAVRPGRATSNGAPCSNGVCAPCPMQHTLGNDPNLGNAQFRLDLAQAPAGSLAWCLIGTGPCAMPGAIVPPLCGPIYAVPVLGNLGPNPTGGVGACGGSTTFAFPLPPAPGLAGWTLSSQCVSLCIGGVGIGTAVSNCLSWTLQGN